MPWRLVWSSCRLAGSLTWSLKFKAWMCIDCAGLTDVRHTQGGATSLQSSAVRFPDKRGDHQVQHISPVPSTGRWYMKMSYCQTFGARTNLIRRVVNHQISTICWVVNHQLFYDVVVNHQNSTCLLHNLLGRKSPDNVNHASKRISTSLPLGRGRNGFYSTIWCYAYSTSQEIFQAS